MVNAKLEPYLGFLHSEQYGKPSLVCDLMELYRFKIDDYLIEHYRNIDARNFVTKKEAMTRKKLGKREFLNNQLTRELMTKLEVYLDSMVEIPRIKHGKRQTLDTLISEEALLFANYLRNGQENWAPRIPVARAIPYVLL